MSEPQFMSGYSIRAKMTGIEPEMGSVHREMDMGRTAKES